MKATKKREVVKYWLLCNRLNLERIILPGVQLNIYFMYIIF